MPLHGSRGNNLLKLSDLSAEEIWRILYQAIELKEKGKRNDAYFPLQGKTLGLIFQHSSTRTRVAFQVGMTQLGGDALFLSAKDTQIGRGESMADTARVLSRYLNGMAARLDDQQDLEELAHFADIPVINALTQMYHPCQILADLMTVHEHFGHLDSLKITYMGDVNNVCNSWIEGAKVLNFPLTVCSPVGSQPPFEEIFPNGDIPSNILWEPDPEKGVKEALVISTDVWVSMGADVNSKENADKKKKLLPYQVNSELLKHAHEEVVVLHCLPAHRGEEITNEVMEGKNAIIFDQSENKLHVQKAVLELCMT